MKKHKTKRKKFLPLFAALILLLTFCGQNAAEENSSAVNQPAVQQEESLSQHASEAVKEAEKLLNSTAQQEETAQEQAQEEAGQNSAGENASGNSETESAQAGSTGSAQENAGQTEVLSGIPASLKDRFQLKNLPAYAGTPYTEVNGNVPYFTEEELAAAANSYETYSPLDSMGRCGYAIASVGQDLMPTEDRGAIGKVKPTGWHTVKYDNVDGKYLYNRCHLIGYQLSAENANERNLITGTRYLNVDGMLPFENMTADYIKETGKHVLYRVSPVFEGGNLLASGVLMEAESVEDRGASILFCVYVYNVQPGIALDYATGGSQAAGGSENAGQTGNGANAGAGQAAQAETGSGQTVQESAALPAAAPPVQETVGQTETYVLNTNTKKFHRPDCSSVARMSEKNRKDYTGTRASVIAEGYEPCKICSP